MKDEQIQSAVFAIKSEIRDLQENLDAILELNFSEKFRDAQANQLSHADESFGFIALRLTDLQNLIGEKP